MFEATPARHERPRSPSQVVHRPSIDAVELGIELPLGFAPPVHVSVAAAIEDIRARLDSVLRFDDFECRRRKRQFAWIALLSRFSGYRPSAVGRDVFPFHASNLVAPLRGEQREPNEGAILPIGLSCFPYGANFIIRQNSLALHR